MRALFACLLAVLAVVAVDALEPFKIKLPTGPSSEQFYTAQGGDMYYTVGTGGTVFGVNLTAKSVQFHSTYDGDVLEGLFAVNSSTSPMLLVGLEDQYIALGPAGNLLWVSSGFQIDTDRKHGYTIIGSKLFIASNENEAFYVVNLLTGLIDKTIDISQGSITGDMALLTQYNQNSGVNELVAYELPSMAILWKVQNVNSFLAANSKYLIVSNDTSDGDVEVLVLDPKTEKTIFTWQAMNGVNSDQFTSEIIGDKFITEVGEETPRVVVYSLKTGEMITQVFLGQDGAVQVVGESIVSISQTVLSIQPLLGGTNKITVNQVPYTADHTIQAAGNSLTHFNVVNLQGWTTWTSKGKYVARNEKSPNAGGNSGGTGVYEWHGYDVMTVGDEVVGTPIE